MHPTILVQRKAQAMQTIMERAQAMAKEGMLEEEQVKRLSVSGVRDIPSVEMMRLEAIADMFTALAAGAGIKIAATTPHKINEFTAPPRTVDDTGTAVAEVATAEEPAPAPTKPRRTSRAKAKKG